MKTFNKTMMMAVSGSALGALLLAGSVHAGPISNDWAAPDQDAAPSQSVSYADLNLGTSAGIAALQQRIEDAATEVCGPTDYRLARGLRQAMRNAQCQEDAIAAAVNQISSRRVATAK